MKLTWRDDTSASTARPSWLTRRLVRHSRSRRPNALMDSTAGWAREPVGVMPGNLYRSRIGSHYLGGNGNDSQPTAHIHERGPVERMDPSRGAQKIQLRGAERVRR